MTRELTGQVFEASRNRERPEIQTGIYMALRCVKLVEPQWEVLVLVPDSRFSEREGTLTVVNERWLLTSCLRLA